MNARIILITMNAAIAFQLSAQPRVTSQPNWLAAIHHCLGPQADIDWFLDLDGEDLELHVTSDRALVILDREPMPTRLGSAELRPCILSTSGTRLERITEPAAVNDSVLVGTYLGVLGGQRALVEQYVRMRNGVLLAKVMVVRKREGSEVMVPRTHDILVCELLNTLRVEAAPAKPAEIAVTDRTEQVAGQR